MSVLDNQRLRDTANHMSRALLRTFGATAVHFEATFLFAFGLKKLLRACDEDMKTVLIHFLHFLLSAPAGTYQVEAYVQTSHS